MECRLARSSTAYSDAISIGSVKTTSSGKHGMYSAMENKKSMVFITRYDAEESRFSSCSTSPSSSCHSLDAFPHLPPTDRRSGASQLSLSPSALSASLSISSSNRSSRASSCAASRYADDHYPLITNIASTSKNVHSSIMDMAQAFNTIIRAINSCYNHALTVDDDEIHDYLFFSQTLFNILSQQLRADQQFLQPLLHKPVVHPRLAIRKAVNIYDDHTFQATLHAWANYIHDSASEQFFSGEDVQSYISTFAPVLVQHLHDEVAQLNSLVNDDILMPEHLTKIWSRFAETLSGALDLYTDAALLVGCYDRHFTINGQRTDQRFPRLPVGTTIMVKKWHSRRHEGAWRFCSSDFSGKRRVISV